MFGTFRCALLFGVRKELNCEIYASELFLLLVLSLLLVFCFVSGCLKLCMPRSVLVVFLYITTAPGNRMDSRLYSTSRLKIVKCGLLQVLTAMIQALRVPANY